MKLFLAILCLCFFVSTSKALSLVKKPLASQINEAEVIALVKLVESKYAEGPKIVKLLTVEVTQGILNSEPGEQLNLIGRNGIVYTELNFNCLGNQAIILMKKVDPKYAPDNFYESVNHSLSVYHIEQEMVIGLRKVPIELYEAIKILSTPPRKYRNVRSIRN
jgi:hypothetical protein